jgi:hypothetical protein
MKKYTAIIFSTFILIINYFNLSAQNIRVEDKMLYKIQILKEKGIFSPKLDTFFINNINTNKVTKVDIEIPFDGNYLYAFPPYPLPAKESVCSLIVWDAKLDINNAEMSVFDLNGDQICGKERITLNKESDYYGIVTWNVNAKIKGIYFIHIKHGTAAIIIKVMID